MAATEQVILVDHNDRPIGLKDKLEAHRQGLCHRAFSVFVFRKMQTYELLLQQRAQKKYHTPNLWTNTCCSHPRLGETIVQAGERRLREELGITLFLKSAGQFHYIAELNNGLTENEIDHVLVGFFDNQSIKPDPFEIQNHRWINIHTLQHELNLTPQKFTPWLGQAFSIALNYLYSENV